MPAAARARRLRGCCRLGCKELKLPQGRLKTGTPPRLDGRTIDYAKLVEQPGDGVGPECEVDDLPVFSFLGDPRQHPRQVSCWITQTNARTHDIVRAGFAQSPMFTGLIDGVGPRYCPSIEDKVNRFAGKDSHQIFLEPEGLATHEVYPNGISTSLPFSVQIEAVRSIAGLEAAHIVRPGYAIEYDFFDPRALRPSFETALDRRAVLRRADQRHDRLRGSGRAGAACGHQRGTPVAGRVAVGSDARPGLPRRPDRRPGVQGRHRAVPHVHQPRRIPAATARGQRRPAPDRGRAAARAWSTTRAGRRFRASASWFHVKPRGWAPRACRFPGSRAMPR